jgi:hypothetical protein
MEDRAKQRKERRDLLNKQYEAKRQQELDTKKEQERQKELEV